MKKNMIIRRAAAIMMIVVITITTGMTCCYAAENEKDETVYVIANSSGESENVIVSDWLKNVEGTDILADHSTLSDIENVKGDETFKVSEEGIIWDANGKDIYYQGKSDKELPIELSITYYLDGNEILPDEIAGKSGHVKIHYQYKNNAKQGDIYTPFMLISGMVLDSEVFSNVKIANGRLLSDGDRNIVIGYGFPGLEVSLKTDDLLEKIPGELKPESIDFDIPDGFELEADVNDFSTSVSMTVAVPLDLSELGLEDIQDWEDLVSKMSELQENINRLIEGTSQLNDGAKELKNGCDQFLEGIYQLDDGAADLAAGAQVLDDGMEQLDGGIGVLNSKKMDLVKGIQQLSDGLNTLNKNKKMLVKGIDQLADGASQLDDGADELKKGMEVLYNGISSLDNNRPLLVNGISELAIGMNQINNNGPSMKQGASGLADGIGQADETLKQLYSGSKQLNDGIFKVNDMLPNALDQLNIPLDQISADIDNSLQAGTTEKSIQELLTGINTYVNNAEQFASAVYSDEERGYITSINEFLSEIQTFFENDDTVHNGICEVDRKLGVLIESLSEDSFSSSRTEISTSSTDHASAIALLEKSIAGDRAVLESLRNVQSKVGSVPGELISKYSGVYSTYSAELDNLIAQLETDIANEQSALEELSRSSDTPDTAKGNKDISALITSLQELKTYTSGLSNAVSSEMEGLEAKEAQLLVNVNQILTGEKRLIKNAAELKAEGENVITSVGTALTEFASESDTQLSTTSKYVKQVSSGITSLKTSLYGNADESSPMLQIANGSSQVTDGLFQLEYSVAENLLTGAGMLSSGIASLFDNGIGVVTSGLNELEKKMPELNSGIMQLMDGAGQLKTGTFNLKNGTEVLADGASQLQGGAAALSSGVEQLAEGGNALKNGSGTLSEGISELKDGSSKLKEGTSALADGTNTLKNGTNQLLDGTVKLDGGIGELAEGTQELKDGIDDIDTEKIDNIIDFLDEDLKDFIDRLQAIKDASESYKLFSDESFNKNDSVKFVIETKGIYK